MTEFADVMRDFQQAAAREEGLALACRAGMDEFAYNTSVVRSADENFRVCVTSGMSPWGDHVCLQVLDEVPGNRTWKFAHFSPAAARLVAHHLNRLADQVEGN